MSPHSEQELRQWLVSAVAGYCRLDPASVRTDQPWHQLGLLSRDAAAMSGRLEALLGTSLPPTLAWRHPSIDQLARALAAVPPPPQPAPGPTHVAASPVVADTPLATLLAQPTVATLAAALVTQVGGKDTRDNDGGEPDEAAVLDRAQARAAAARHARRQIARRTAAS